MCLEFAAVHDATMNSPHDKVRVFFNRTSVDALRGGNVPLPIGAMVVKELYEGDGTTLDGYAVMVKTTATSWTWWEAFPIQPGLSGSVRRRSRHVQTVPLRRCKS